MKTTHSSAYVIFVGTIYVHGTLSIMMKSMEQLHLKRNEDLLQKYLKEIKVHHRQTHGGQIKDGSLDTASNVSDP